MAVEISEYKALPKVYGNTPTICPLPARHSQVATGTTFTPQAGTQFLTILPDADTRMAFTSDGSTPPSPAGDTTRKLYKANVEAALFLDLPASGVRLRFA